MAGAPRYPAIHRHDEKVRRLRHDLGKCTGERPVSTRKRTVSHQVPKAHDLRRQDDVLDVRDLDEILSIDVERRICVAEAGVSFAALVDETLKYGLVPAVVPELKTITIGGAVSGCSIESSSFVHGGFHDTCLEYEVLTGAGEVLVCAPDGENGLLFQMLHGSFGTLGILTKLTFRLVPAKPFVAVAYERHTTLSTFHASIARHFAARDVDFMDGIIHAPDLLVLCIGRYVDEAPYLSRYDWLKIYYQSTRTRARDYLRTADYFFRYDRGVTNVRPKSLIGRLLFGKLLASSAWLRIAEWFPFLLRDRSPAVTLDVFIPFSRVPGFMSWYEREIGFFPLWCVPYKRVRDYEWLAPAFYRGLDDLLFVDLAIYGLRQTGARNLHRVIEEALPEFRGLKTLISHNYYSEDEFWSIWNKDNYDRVKARTDPRNLFRDLYDRTCRAPMGKR
jgi:FAD/FMN-containing dehydrogenase